MNTSLDWYRIFCTVVRTGNMTAAARELYISQPAVSMAMRQLEEALGGRLLLRTTKGVQPTAEGRVLYEYVKQAMELVTTAEEKVAAMQQLAEGKLSIGASDTVISRLLLPFLETFHEQYPQVNIRVTNKTTDECLRLLQSGAVDLCFINLPVAETSRLEITPFFTVHDCLIAGPKYAHLAQAGLSWQALGEYPLLLLEPLSNTRRNLDAFALQNGVALAPEFQLGSYDLLLEFARIGLGLTFAVREFTDFMAEGLVEIPLTPPVPERQIGLVTLKGLELSRAAQTFVDEVQKGA